MKTILTAAAAIVVTAAFAVLILVQVAYSTFGKGIEFL